MCYSGSFSPEKTKEVTEITQPEITKLEVRETPKKDRVVSEVLKYERIQLIKIIEI